MIYSTRNQPDVTELFNGDLYFEEETSEMWSYNGEMWSIIYSPNLTDYNPPDLTDYNEDELYLERCGL